MLLCLQLAHLGVRSYGPNNLVTNLIYTGVALNFFFHQPAGLVKIQFDQPAIVFTSPEAANAFSKPVPITGVVY